MPPLEIMDRHQAAVLWAATGFDSYGQPTVDLLNPVELLVRWVYGRKEVLDRQGNTITIDATVVVAEDVVVDSLMWLGGIADLPVDSGQPEVDVMLVRTIDVTTDLRNRFTRRVLGLVRYKDTLPG